MRKIVASVITAAILSSGAVVFANSPSEWALASAKTAETLNIGYPAGTKKYNKALTRGELAYVAVNLHKHLIDQAGGTSPVINDADRTLISSSYVDSYNNGKLFSDEIMLAIKYGLMHGTSTDKFSQDGIVTREQTAAVLYRIAEKAEILNLSNQADLTRFTDHKLISSYAYQPFSLMVGENVISGKSANSLKPLDTCTYEEVLAIAVRFADLAPKNTVYVDPFVDNYVYNLEETDSIKVFPVEYYSFSWEMDMFNDTYNSRNVPITRYQSNEEALQDMRSITINVWSLKSNGDKVASTKTLLVHKDVAEDVISIFDEIFSGEEKFPIISIGGYSWRGANSTSSHNNGLAIDINADQNYFIDTEGNILVGKHWKPNEDPYSIKEDGDAVRAFENKGWFWGGYGWSTTGYDYMHFSYTGV